MKSSHYTMAGEMAQWVRVLSKHGDLSSNPQCPHKKDSMTPCTGNTNTGNGDR